jgi:hypothetical protein
MGSWQPPFAQVRMTIGAMLAMVPSPVESVHAPPPSGLFAAGDELHATTVMTASEATDRTPVYVRSEKL